MYDSKRPGHSRHLRAQVGDRCSDIPLNVSKVQAATLQQMLERRSLSTKSSSFVNAACGTPLHVDDYLRFCKGSVFHLNLELSFIYLEYS